MARGKATPVEHSVTVHQHTEVTIHRWERIHPKAKTTTKPPTGYLPKARSTCAAAACSPAPVSPPPSLFAELPALPM